MKMLLEEIQELAYREDNIVGILDLSKKNRYKSLAPIVVGKSRVRWKDMHRLYRNRQSGSGRCLDTECRRSGFRLANNMRLKRPNALIPATQLVEKSREKALGDA